MEVDLWSLAGTVERIPLDLSGRSYEGINNHSGKRQRFDRRDVAGRLGGQRKSPTHASRRCVASCASRSVHSSVRRALRASNRRWPSRDSTAWRAAEARPAVLVAGARPAAAATFATLIK